eukprot:RCo001393
MGLQDRHQHRGKNFAELCSEDWPEGTHGDVAAGKAGSWRGQRGERELRKEGLEHRFGPRGQLLLPGVPMPLVSDEWVALLSVNLLCLEVPAQNQQVRRAFQQSKDAAFVLPCLLFQAEEDSPNVVQLLDQVCAHREGHQAVEDDQVAYPGEQQEQPHPKCPVPLRVGPQRTLPLRVQQKDRGAIQGDQLREHPHPHGHTNCPRGVLKHALLAPSLHKKRQEGGLVGAKRTRDRQHSERNLKAIHHGKSVRIEHQSALWRVAGVTPHPVLHLVKVILRDVTVLQAVQKGLQWVARAALHLRRQSQGDRTRPLSSRYLSDRHLLKLWLR